ncbi:unnamed protein product [Phaeothamnion confervicola]
MAMQGARGTKVLSLLAEHGAAALQPRQGPNGHLIQPLVSKRRAAEVRKEAMKAGTFGAFSAHQGGWRASWDETRAPILRRPPRLHKNQRTRADRAAKIEAKLLEQPKLIAEHKKALQALKPETGFLALVKKLTSTGRPEQTIRK